MSIKINILSPQEAIKIAAGEVIERQANVIKELLENSLDADATAISLYINDTGKTLIRIVDNGCGMSQTDAQNCFLPHATSKINSLDDLTSIESFGFRGEALASIAAISTVTLITKEQETPDEIPGYKIVYREGNILEESDVACPSGTDIQIHNLFFNTPVRKKFLKNDETEWNAIMAIVNAICLAHHTVSFKLFRDNKMMLNAPAVTAQKDRIAQVIDLNLTQNLIPLPPIVLPPVLEKQNFFLTGFISHPNVCRYNKSHFYFFVNHRWIKNNELGKAVLKGYDNALPPQRYPVVCLFITIDQQHIDVNVHPKKEEVRFTNTGLVGTAVATAVKNALESLAGPAKQELHTPPVQSFTQSTHYTAPAPQNFSPIPEPYHTRPVAPKPNFNTLLATIVQEQTVITPKQAQPEYSITGQLYNTYIVLQDDAGITIIDQHAAHERVLYERKKQSFEKVETFPLLFPETIVLEKEQISALEKTKKFFSDQGIVFEKINDYELLVHATPPAIKGPSLAQLFCEAAAFIEEFETLDASLFTLKYNEYLLGQIACKTAIKAGDPLTTEQMQKLVKDLFAVDNRFRCVHGRPTIWTIPKATLEKQFRR
jgi:DNA mismatch repair protein MutL